MMFQMPVLNRLERRKLPIERRIENLKQKSFFLKKNQEILIRIVQFLGNQKFLRYREKKSDRTF